MDITINDYRHEDRRQNAAVDENGQPLPDLTHRGRLGDEHVTVRTFDRSYTDDRREVSVRTRGMDEDSIPEVLDPADYIHFGRQTFAFEPTHVTVIYQRRWSSQAEAEKGSYNYQGPKWKITRLAVSGPNIRKDGSLGEKPQTISYPTESDHDTGEVWTEADRTVEEGNYLYRSQTQRIGKPKYVRRVDELPLWLSDIVARTHPAAAWFTFGEVHRFGDFTS